MTDHTTPMFDEMDEIELIVTYLQGRLPAERAEAVKRRLTEDPAFLEFAAPLLLTWSVPKHIVRNPRPEGETERAWAEFVKRTGFPNRPQEPPAAAPAPAPRRALWRIGRIIQIGFGSVLLFYILLAFGMIYWHDVIKPIYFPDPPDGWVAPEPVTDLVPYQSGWIRLENGIAVQLTPGAELRVLQRRLRGMRHLILTGTARFRVPDLDPPDTPMRTQVLVVQTPVGYVTASESEFTVVAGAYTTDVQVHALPAHGNTPPSPMTLAAVIEPVDADQILVMVEPGSARLVRGRNPVRLPSSR